MSAVAAMTTIATTVFADGDWDHMDGGGWVLMGIGMLIFWGLVILGIVWVVRTLGDGRGGGISGRREPSAAEVLDRKLAEGAISVEDYKERRQVLTGGEDAGSTGTG